ncbi:acyltransferase [Mesorhizobium sp. C416B]|uniref:acyltransferase family protein n=1 Tax=unclassified Mesorhizobium TaxID=325217 RepID=UPI00051855FB|nr:MULTISPECIES: acyltransferase [unclassified Mesorhizobium]WJI60712.1 acyltransferase [Mesorhizobium sp. C416B]
MGRLENLDGLRGFAALLVVAGHVCNVLGFLPGVFGDGGAQVGVQLFFCLSGFLMGMLYLNLPFSGAEVAGFYRRRIARVFPMYLAVVLASFVIMNFTGTPVLYAVDHSNLAAHLTFFQATSVLWTVPIEVQFYALFGLIWLMFSINRLASILMLLTAIPLLVIMSDTFGGRLFFVSYFMVGLGVSLLPRTSSNASFAVAVALFFAAMPAVSKRLGIDFFDFWKSPLNFAAVALLVQTAISAPLATRTLGSRPARYLGEISYSIYLLHWPVMAQLSRWISYAEHPALYTSLVLAGTLVAATLTYYGIEKPARRLIMTRTERHTNQVVAIT